MKINIDFKKRAKEKLKEFIDRGIAIPKKIAKGKTIICNECENKKTIIPFQLYGVKFPDYVELICPKCNYRELHIVESEKKVEFNWIILLQGIPIRITDKEKKDYLNTIPKGGGVIIRDYVIDKLYPIIPAKEYDRHIESYIN